jgi:phage-related protein (TIGR01555 family)
MRKRATRQFDPVKRFSDGISNPLLRIGTGTNNTFSATTYKPEFITLNRQQLEWCYQSSWLGDLAVDSVAEDMTREGIEIRCEQPDVIDDLKAAFDDFGVFDSLCEAVKWSRLYGGAIAVILIDGQSVEEPLTTVPRGSFRGLAVLDRWQIDQTNVGEKVEALGADFGKPKYYRVLPGMSEIDFKAEKIHYSRVIRLEGRRMPYYIRTSYMGWGASVLEPVWNRLQGFDLATEGATQLLSKAYLRYYKVKGLRDILTNDLANRGFKRQMDIVREFQSAEGMTLGDKDDEFQIHSYTFAGIPDILLQLGQQISGALGIPLVRLFGQSPAGLSSTGESDLRMYYDKIKQQQSTILRTGVKKLLDIVWMSVTGQPVPSDLNFVFNPLWQMSKVDQTTVLTTGVSSIRDTYEQGLIDLPTALKELKRLSDEVGVFSSITDADIAEAERMEANEAPPEGALNADPEI